jgi:CRISPR/Cas system-associated exonuclease Cas4 (RecB family)
MAEQYLKDERKMYPPDLQPVAAHAMSLKAKGAIAEQKLAVTEDWKACEYDSPDAYFRAIIDVTVLTASAEDQPYELVSVQDWKTGQVYPEHAAQLDRYLAVAAAHYESKEYESRLIYIDQGKVTPPKRISAQRVMPIRLMLDGAIKNAESDTIFPKTPGKGCKWCGYSRKYGGPCEH